MKIHSFSKIIAFPFLIVAGIILYYLFFEDKASWYPYLIPIAVILSIIYAFHPKLDFWWHKRQPPELDTRLKKLIYQASPFYQALDDAGKRKFLDRLSIFIHHKAFFLMRKEKEALPEDIKAMISINAITIGFFQEEYFFDKYDYYFAYQHPFPTPTNHDLHSVEVNHEDGVMIFNADQLFQCTMVNTQLFNTGLYAFSEAFLVSDPLSVLSQAEEPDIHALNDHSYFSPEKIIEQIGYKEIYAKAVVLALYFIDGSLTEKRFPEFHALCREYFS